MNIKTIDEINELSKNCENKIIKIAKDRKRYGKKVTEDRIIVLGPAFLQNAYDNLVSGIKKIDYHEGYNIFEIGKFRNTTVCCNSACKFPPDGYYIILSTTSRIDITPTAKRKMCYFGKWEIENYDPYDKFNSKKFAPIWEKDPNNLTDIMDIGLATQVESDIEKLLETSQNNITLTATSKEPCKIKTNYTPKYEDHIYDFLREMDKVLELF